MVWKKQKKTRIGTVARMTKKRIEEGEQEKEEAGIEEIKKEKKQEERKELGKDQKIKQLTQDINELTETLQRLQAEFENYKKRAEKENKEYKCYAEAELVKRLLPVLDSFELAIQSNNNDAEKLKKGIEAIYAQLYSMLSHAGLKPIKAAGERFDAYKHEVLMKEESEKDGVVLEELQKGYTFKDLVIRHSKIKVGKKEEKKVEKKEYKKEGIKEEEGEKTC